MSDNRKQLIKKFINEGFTHRTLSLFSDQQLTTLGKKLFTETLKDDEKLLNQQLAANLRAQADETEVDEEVSEEIKNIETDDTGNPDAEIDGVPLLVELPKEVEEDFASKAQQKYLYAVNPAAAEKLASKMTPQDYKNLPEYVNEQKALEDWILDLVESKQKPEITKANFIKTIQEHTGCGDVSDSDDPYTIGTEDQKDSFANVVEIAREMVPPMNVEVDGFDADGHLNGYLQAPESEQVIELNICPAGNIKLDGNPLGSMELSETDRDDEGEYIGAPEATTAPPPLKTPTIAPSRPGEKKRRGPFERPKTTPKPKAKNKSTLPDWLTSTNLGKALTQHG